MPTRSWNRVELIGNLTRDPELRYTPTGTAVATFSIATNRTFMTDGEKREEADFHRIVAWSKLAELCSQLLKKGNRVFVSGRLQNREWEGQDGNKRQTTEIVIEDMLLLTSREGNGGDYSADMPAEIPTRNVEEMPEDTKGPGSEGTGDEGVDNKEEEKAEKPDKKSQPEKEEVEDIDDLPF